jgi:SlyX protein
LVSRGVVERRKNATSLTAVVLRSGAMDERLTDLEIRYTHLERLVQELSTAVYDERLQREKLEARVKDLEQRLGGVEDPAPNEPPPHY